jgi:hypothetical protein
MCKLKWLLLILLLASGCTNDVSSSEKTGASNASRCQPASTAQITAIRAGVKGIQASNDVRAAFAVRSNDFDRVYMVSAKIYGPGMENGTGPGIWAISGDPNNPGLTLAVDGFAHQFSDYPEASKTQAAITQSADGVDAARVCAK